METHVKNASLDLLQSHLRHAYVVVPLGRQTTEVLISISSISVSGISISEIPFQHSEWGTPVQETLVTMALTRASTGTG